MAFFYLSGEDDFAKTLLYEDVPSYYKYNKQLGKFHRRCRTSSAVDIYCEHVLAQVYTVHPNNHGCYFLCLLLHSARGPTSFENLKIVDNILYPTFHAACQAQSLLENDNHWNDTLPEASVLASSEKMRTFHNNVGVLQYLQSS